MIIAALDLLVTAHALFAVVGQQVDLNTWATTNSA